MYLYRLVYLANKSFDPTKILLRINSGLCVDVSLFISLGITMDSPPSVSPIEKYICDW